MSTEVFSNFLEQAGYLLAEGYKDAAAVMIGSVLEQNLRQLCNEFSIDTAKNNKKKKHISANDMNILLRKHNVYNIVDYKNIESCLGLRTCAAHGHYNEYSHDQVNNMLKIVLEFLARVKKSFSLENN